MGDVISFKRGIDVDIDTLIDRIEAGGLLVSIIRNRNNWKGDLAFSFVGGSATADAIVAAQEMHSRFERDKELRLRMYEEAFSIGYLYYEAGTSTALSFHENETPKEWRP